MKVNPMNDQVAMYHISVGAIDVDKYGNVWTLKKHYQDGTFRDVTPRIYKTRDDRGYIRIGLYLSNKYYNIFAHRIVWLFYKGLIPDGLQINHKNGIKDNNRPENLEVVTCQQNIIHAINVLGIRYKHRKEANETINVVTKC